MSWPDPEFTRQLAGHRARAERDRLVIVGMTWRDSHLTVETVKRRQFERDQREQERLL